MATPALANLNIKKIISFKHLPSVPLGKDPEPLLRRVGIEEVNINLLGYDFSVGEISVLGNTFRGLMVKETPTSTSCPFTVTLLRKGVSLRDKALQVGIRLTQSADIENNPFLRLLDIEHGVKNVTSKPIAGTLTEANSVYYEFVLYYDSGLYRVVLNSFVNKQLIAAASCLIYPNEPVNFRFADSGRVPMNDEDFTFLFDDIYIAELDYNSNGTVTPQLLGELSVEPFTVASYQGDEHTNTQGLDIVTALNNFNPNADMGTLSLKAGAAPASITFNTPDITNRTILGAALNVVYKDSIAPNNQLNYQITQAGTRLPAKTDTERHADNRGYSTFTQFITTPAVGEAWDAANVTFKLDLVNQVAD